MWKDTVVRLLLMLVCLPVVQVGARADGPAATPRADGADDTDYRVDDSYLVPDPVVVTGGRGTALETARTVDRLDARKVAETQARDLGEALAEIPGASIQSTNRGATAPILRGLIGPQNLIIVDGLRFNLATFRTGPNQYLGLFDPGAVDAIEVLRGPSAVMYGNGAMGGVVQLLTEPLPPPSARLTLTPRGSLRFSSADGGVGASVSGALAYRKFGLSVGISTDRLGELRTGGGETLAGSNFQRLFWRAKVGYTEDTWRLTAAYFGGSITGAPRFDRLGSGETRRYDNLDHFAYLSFDWRPEDSPLGHFKVSVGYHGLTEVVERYNCDTSAGIVVDRVACARQAASVVSKTRLNDDLVHGLNANLSASFQAWGGRLRVLWGGDIGWDQVARSTRVDAVRDDDFSPILRDRGNFSTPSEFITAGAFLRVEATPLSLSRGKYQLRLNGGARVSYFGASAPDVPGVGHVDYNHVGVVASGGLQFVIAETFNLYASFAQGFRAPNLQETTVLGDTGNFFEVPNPELGPERNNTFEVGARLNLSPVRVSASFFHTTLTGLIDRAPSTFEGATAVDGKEVRTRVNAAEATYLGVEGNVDVFLGKGFSVGAAVTWLQGDVTNGGMTQPARRAPPAFGTARLRYEPGKLAAYAELFTRWAAPQDRLHADDLRDPRICETAAFSGQLADPCAGSPGWATVGLRAGLRPVEQLRMDFQVTNATDAHYRVHGSGYPQPGIDARITLQMGL